MRRFFCIFHPAVYILLPILPSTYSASGSSQDSPCKLTITHPVPAATLAELLDIPLVWDKSEIRQNMTSVSHIHVNGGGGVIGSFGIRPCLPLGNGSYQLLINLGLPSCVNKASPVLANTLEQLLRFCDTGTGTCSMWRMPCDSQVFGTRTTIRDIKILLAGGNLEKFKLCLESVSIDWLTATLSGAMHECLFTLSHPIPTVDRSSFLKCPLQPRDAVDLLEIQPANQLERPCPTFRNRLERDYASGRAILPKAMARRKTQNWRECPIVDGKVGFRRRDLR